jgi:hypothetical protein
MLAMLTAVSIVIAPVVPIISGVNAALGINRHIQMHKPKQTVEPIK